MGKKSYLIFAVISFYQFSNLYSQEKILQIQEDDKKALTNEEKATIKDSGFTSPKLEFRGRLFSDFVGLKADNPNGLIQTTFLFSYTRKYDSLKYTIPVRNSFEIIPFRNVVLADFTFSKIDQNNRDLPVRYMREDTVSGYLNRLDLYQYAFFNVTGKLNLFTIRFFASNKEDSIDKKNCNKKFSITYPYESFRFYCDVIGTFYNTSISDSLKRSDMKSVNSIAWGFNFRATFYPSHHFNLKAELEYTHFFPTLFTNTYKEIAGPQYLSHKGLLTQDMIDEDKYAIDAFDLVFVRTNENKSQQFLRLSIFGNYFSKASNTSPNIFYQLQLGADFTLNDLFKK